MSNYIDISYPQTEFSVDDYPQQLCRYISQRYFFTRRNGNRLLDIGSGKGNHLIAFSRLGFNTYGLDKNDNSSFKFDIRKCDIDKEIFPFDNNYFDFIFSKSVLEHVINTDNFLLETFRVLKPGGIAVILTPDWRSQSKCFYDDYTHVKPFTQKSLRNAMLVNRFEDVECSYFLQLPIVWKYPSLKYFSMIIALLPDSLKWKHDGHRKLIRFSKEKMLLCVGRK